MDCILVTGGAGYIGSHVCKALSQAGYLPVVYDNLSRGHSWAVRFGPFVCGDLHSREDLAHAFSMYQPTAVIHLAAHSTVRESITDPKLYYHNNVAGTLALVETMLDKGIKNLVFSSTAAIYGVPDYVPIDEKHHEMPLNPYGKTKWMIEQLLSDCAEAYGLCSLVLRYFNAAGADLDCELGEAHEPETHLIPRTIFAAQNPEIEIPIYCTSHPTPDGTAVRDYVHVWDLALAHVQGLNWIKEHKRPLTLNLGAGRGYSVREVIAAVEAYSGCTVKVRIENSAVSEAPILIANPLLAEKTLGWHAEHSTLETIISSAWKWHEKFLCVKSP